jgi:hypothetical protein
MLAATHFPMETVLLLALGALAIQMFSNQPARRASRPCESVADYLYKIARITGHSEYEIFKKSAETWPVSNRTIDRDFKYYLIHQQTPHYVNDFVRKNRRQIDELNLPPV